MHKSIPLSVAIITKNEAKNLPDCLESIAFAEQIVVVDSGSTDDTVKIAREFGSDVFIETWRGFGPQKQFAIDQCRNAWILILDADERIPGDTAQEIIRIISDSSTMVAGFSFTRKNFFQGRWIKHAGWWPDRVVRLFQKNRGRLTQAQVHESVEVDGFIVELGYPIEHFTESSLSKVLQKIDQYSTIGAEESYRGGRTSSIWFAAFRAKLTFFQNYILRLGFLDGPQGFTLAITDAVNKFFKYAKLAEMNKKIKNKL
jgi:(heptosyl)LPS beta-1,4-glucosyltransferase